MMTNEEYTTTKQRNNGKSVTMVRESVSEPRSRILLII